MRTRLNSILMAEIVQRQPASEVNSIYITDRQDVLTKPRHLDTTRLAPCNQEEADSRIFLLVADAVNEGLQLYKLNVYLYDLLSLKTDNNVNGFVLTALK